MIFRSTSSKKPGLLRLTQLAFICCLIGTPLSAAAAAVATAVKKKPAIVTPPQLGINLSAVVDYTREWPFVNAFKVARTWISQQHGLGWGMGTPLKLTTDGYPAYLLTGQYAETLIYDNAMNAAASFPTGHYTVIYDGSGTIQFDLQSATILSQTAGRMVINVPAGQNGIYLMITATNPRNPISNIRLIMPGFENTYQSSQFHPTFLNTLKGYRALRFMEWMQTNTSTIKSWSDRPTPNDYTFSRRGVALETMIQLANQTGASPWFNIPHMADDDFVRRFAQMIKLNLNASIPFYIEYSNETWNTQFSQTAYVRLQGLSLGLSADPVIAGAYYTAVRSVQIFNIFQSVFGNTSRFQRIIASQAANPWLQEQTIMYNNAYQSTDALAIAPYFSDCSDASIGGYGVLGAPANAAQTDAMSVQQVLAAEQEHIQNCVLNEMTGAATVASNYHVKLIGYEGGQSLIGTGSSQNDAKMSTLFAAANRDPGMGALYDLYLQNWKAAGGDLFMNFSDVTSYTVYGNFGSMERQDQDPTTAPKFQSLMRYSATYN